MTRDRPPASAVVRPCGTVTSSPDSPRLWLADGERRHELVAGLSLEAIHAENWRMALIPMEPLPDGFRYAMPSTPGTGNRLVRFGLAELPVDSPAGDLERLRSVAESAVVASNHEDAAVLETLARVHWELGDVPKAIGIQREAIAVHAAGTGEPAAPEAPAPAVP